MSQCPQCGAPSRVGQSFCGNCGTNLAHEESELERTAIRPIVLPDEPAPAAFDEPPIWVPVDEPIEPPGQLAPDDPTAQFPVQPEVQPARTPPPASPPASPPAPPPAYAAPSTSPLAKVDLSWLTAGNWLGAAKTAGAALGVALVFSLFVAIGSAEDLDGSSVIGMTALLTGATFGADLINDSEGLTASVGQYPLLGTVLALAAAAVAFRRTTSSQTAVRSALWDGVRASGLLALGLMLLAIVVRMVKPELSGYDGADEAEASAELPGSLAASGLGVGNGETVMSIAAALFLSLFLVLATLTVACLLRRDWLDATLAQLHSWLAAPLMGLGAVIGGLFVAGLVYLVAIMVGEDSARDLSQFVGLLAVLPSLGMRLLGLGSGAEFGIAFRSDGESEELMNRLSDFADDHGALFWISPVLVIAIALAGVYAVIRRSPDRSVVRRNVLVYLGLLLLAMPFLVRFANFHVNVEGDRGDGDFDYSAVAGVDGFQTTMLFFLISLAAALVLLVATGNLDLRQVRSKASEFARSVQTTPGQKETPPAGPPPGPTAPPPGWQPPTGPPPGPPPGWSPPPGPPPER